MATRVGLRGKLQTLASVLSTAALMGCAAMVYVRLRALEDRVQWLERAGGGGGGGGDRCRIPRDVGRYHAPPNEIAPVADDHDDDGAAADRSAAAAYVAYASGPADQRRATRHDTTRRPPSTRPPRPP